MLICIMIYEDEYIANLLKCEKEITDPPSKNYKQDRGHWKKNFTLCSLDGNFNFRAFIRYNDKFIENFTIGLDYTPKDEKRTICLLRCNGPHGENKAIPHHVDFHIHIANAETINCGQKSEKNVEITKEYATLDQAIEFFIKHINLKKEDINKHFPFKQPELFNNYE